MKTRMYAIELGDFQRVYTQLVEFHRPWDDKYTEIKYAIKLLLPILADNSEANIGSQEYQEEKILTLTSDHLIQVLKAMEHLMDALPSFRCTGYENEYTDLQQIIHSLKASCCLMIRNLY